MIIPFVVDVDAFERDSFVSFMLRQRIALFGVDRMRMQAIVRREFEAEPVLTS